MKNTRLTLKSLHESIDKHPTLGKNSERNMQIIKAYCDDRLKHNTLLVVSAVDEDEKENGKEHVIRYYFEYTDKAYALMSKGTRDLFDDPFEQLIFTITDWSNEDDVDIEVNCDFGESSGLSAHFGTDGDDWESLDEIFDYVLTDDAVKYNIEESNKEQEDSVDEKLKEEKDLTFTKDGEKYASYSDYVEKTGKHISEEEYKEFIYPQIVVDFEEYKSKGMSNDKIRDELIDAYYYKDLIDKVFAEHEVKENVSKCFTKEEAQKFAEELSNYFYENGNYYEIWADYDRPDCWTICSEIGGDWKHDHLYFDYIAEKFFKEKGINVTIDTEVLEDTGADWYPARHTIRKA